MHLQPPANNRFPSIPIYPFFLKKIKLAFSNQNTHIEIILFFRSEESVLYTNENKPVNNH